MKGDLIMPQSSRIITRSRAKQTPTEYTKVDANLKIIKILIEELPSPRDGPGPSRSITSNAATNGGDGDDDSGSEDDGEWEDDDNDFLDLGSGMTKADLMAYGNDTGPTAWNRADDESQQYLLGWFREAGQRPGFEGVFGQLTDAERDKLRSLLG